MRLGGNTSHQCPFWPDCSNHSLEDHLICRVWNSPASSWLCPWSFHSFLLNPWRWVLPPPPSDCCFVNRREEGRLGQPAVKCSWRGSRAEQRSSAAGFLRGVLQTKMMGVGSWRTNPNIFHLHSETLERLSRFLSQREGGKPCFRSNSSLWVNRLGFF